MDRLTSAFSRALDVPFGVPTESQRAVIMRSSSECTFCTMISSSYSGIFYARTVRIGRPPPSGASREVVGASTLRILAEKMGIIMARPFKYRSRAGETMVEGDVSRPVRCLAWVPLFGVASPDKDASEKSSHGCD
jgi:hypothetical protein